MKVRRPLQQFSFPGGRVFSRPAILKKIFDQIVSKFEQVRQDRFKSLQVGTRRHKTQQEGQEVTRRDKFIGFGPERGRMDFWLVLGAAGKIIKIV